MFFLNQPQLFEVIDGYKHSNNLFFVGIYQFFSYTADWEIQSSVMAVMVSPEKSSDCVSWLVASSANKKRYACQLRV